MSSSCFPQNVVILKLLNKAIGHNLIKPYIITLCISAIIIFFDTFNFKIKITIQQEIKNVL